MDEKRPIVSVITPFYNEPFWMLEENINSVSEQLTEYPFEHIIVCANPDRIKEIEEHNLKNDPGRPSIITIIKSSEKLGIAKARNLGIENSSGKYIIPLDCDDMFIQGRIQKQISLMEEKKLEHSFGGYIEMHEKIITNKIVIPEYKESVKQELKRFNNICYSGSNCFSRNLYFKVNGYDEKAPVEDLELWVSFAYHGVESFCIKEPLYYLRVHSDNITAKLIRDGVIDRGKEYIKNKYNNF